MCARGASALENALDRYPRGDVRVLVVWMPALRTDRNPPTGASRIRDPRVVELWDPRLWLSNRVIRYSGQAPGGSGVAFDWVAYFAPGTEWADPFPTPTSWGSPIETSTGLIDAALQH